MIVLPIPKKTTVLIGGLLVIIFVLVFFFLNKSSVGPLPLPSPAPSLLPPQGDTDVLEKQQEVRSQYPLLDFTPYESPDFGITYIGPLHFKITLWGKDKAAAREAALTWIKEKGVVPASHQITWEEKFQP